MTTDLRELVHSAVGELAPQLADPESVADAVLERVPTARRTQSASRHMWVHAVAAAVLALAASFVLARSPEPKTSAPADPVPAKNQWPVGAEWRLGVDWTAPEPLSRRQYVLWQSAIQRCMTLGGRDYDMPSYSNNDADVILLNPLNPASVAAGYKDVPIEERPSPPVKPPDADAAAECANTASDFVYGAPAAKAFSAMLDTLIPTVDRTISGFEETPLGRDRIAAWSACMASQGFKYPSPAAARAAFSRTIPASGRERRVRTADFECDRRTDLTKSRSIFETDALQRWLASNADRVAAVTELQRAAEMEIGQLETEFAADDSPAPGQRGGPSQSPGDAARDGVLDQVAALPVDDRSERQATAASAEGTWVLSRPASSSFDKTDGCALGDKNGTYGIDFICTSEYGEVLLVDAAGAIEKAYPMAGVPPKWMHVTDAAVYGGAIGDGALPDSTIFRIDRNTRQIAVIYFEHPDSTRRPLPAGWRRATAEEQQNYAKVVTVGPDGAGTAAISTIGPVVFVDVDKLDGLFR